MEIGAYEAKTTLGSLLERARRGETITITKHGVPVARLVPPGARPARTTDAVAAFDELRAQVRPGPPSIREMIDEGRQR